MGFWLPAAFCLFIAFSNSYRSFVDTAPLQISNGNNRSNDEPVEELESLKHALETIPKQLGDAKQLSISKSMSSFFSDINGHRTGHNERQGEVVKNGEMMAKVTQQTDVKGEKDSPARSHTKTEIEIPSEGIHRKIEKDDEKEDPSEIDPMLNKISALTGIGYSPMDMAEYVFWTGDEKGVAWAIEDFLQEGVMSRDEAIAFLQSIKSNLNNIQAHYQGLKKMETKIANKLQQQMSVDPSNSNVYEEALRTARMDAMQSKSNSYGSNLMKSMTQEAFEEKQKRQQQQQNMVDSEDYEEMVEKIKASDNVYNDYTLEEVIYELAKVMFSQSLTQGSKEAHNALKRFTNYLEKEVAYGQISRELEKKILGVLIAALSDTIGERPELLAAASEGLSNIDSTHSSFREPRKHVLERRNLIKATVEKSMKKLNQDLKEAKNK